MGALTIKMSAYGSRPWELVQIHVPNYFRSSCFEPEELLLQIRSNVQVVRIQSTGWITDRVRFSADGFRRQRLTSLWVGNSRVSWSVGFSVWWSLVVSHSFWWRTDAWLVAHGTCFRLYQLIERGRRPAVISFDTYVACAVYHGVYGHSALTNYTSVAFPGCHPYEEDKLLRAPAGVARWYDWSSALVNIIGFITSSKKQNLKVLHIGLPKHDVSCLNIRSYTAGAFACLKVSSFQQLINPL